MKKLIFISLSFIVLQTFSYAQKNLSEDGYKHWIKAVALMGNIKEATDYFLVVDEFSKVLKTDPTYADVFYNKGVLYAKMGELGGGIPMFDNAKVSVIVNQNFIRDITPNPTNAYITVSFQLDRSVRTAQLQIVNNFGVVQNAISINPGQQSQDVNVSAYRPGTYTVQLYANGVLCDSQTFVKQ